ncbi:MAG: FMN-binding protein [Firmicutes bacterium]|nr:FMN-binding protein [Bacillota bacterium]
MKQYTKMLTFVFIMGFLTSLVFVGMDALTAERIEANKDAAIYSAVLNHNEIGFNSGNLADVFNENITVEEVIYEGQTFSFYINKANGNVSFMYGVFALGGLWGPLRGVITLESDFQTIVNVTVLEEQETPGLGGKVKNREFLDQFIGLVLIPELDRPVEVNKDAAANGANEVDEISGATGTSTAFERLLNDSYQIYRDLWLNRGGQS